MSSCKQATFLTVHFFTDYTISNVVIMQCCPPVVYSSYIILEFLFGHKRLFLIKYSSVSSDIKL